MATHSSILAWTEEVVHGQRNLVSYSPWGLKESDTIERLSTAAIANGVWEKISKNLLSPRLGSGVHRRWDKQASFGKKRQPTGLCLEAYICKEWVSFS